MKIKRVDIVGFKSFVEKVSLDFQEGVTAILGPNGCGKSNIVDAIRWAMGEQNAKNLRGRSMEDVIFGGSEARRPLGMAEVSMTFANDDGLAPPAYRDYSEIMVTRRLYRDGESEYLINKTPCRLLDITELFMDTGVGARAYSIIEQGKIGMILNAKPEDRRFLIEEAAGVTKFKSRKKSALRKIEATRQNLLRLGDIVAEVRRQLGSLKRQAQKAQRFRELREELREIETRFARERFRELAAEGEALVRRLEERRRALEDLGFRLAEGEARMEEARLQQAAREREAAQGQERVFHLTSEIQKAEGKLEMGVREIASLDRQRERLVAEAEEAGRRLGDLDREEQELQAAQSALGADLEAERRALSEGEGALEECAAREQEIVARLEEARTRLYAVLTDLSRLASRHDEARRRLQALSERSGRNRSEAVTVREQMGELQGLLDALEGSLRQFRERRLTLGQEKEEIQERLRLLRRQGEETENLLLVRREELNRCRSRLESLQQLEKNLEGYGGGLRALLARPEFRERFADTVADILDVPAPLEAAVEAVLGDRVQALLSSGAEDVRGALAFLRAQEGRCTFLLPAVAAPPLPASVPGGSPLAELVRPRPGREEAVAALLSGVFLVETLEPFLSSGAPAGTVLVTEGGETLTYRGEITGGGRSALDAGLLHRKREMKELAAGEERLAREVAELQERRLSLREETARAEEESREVEAALHRKDLKVMDSEKDLDRLRGESGRLQERLEILSLEEDQLHGEEEEMEGQLASAEEGRRELEARKLGLEETVASLQEEAQVLRRETETVRERVTALKVTVASIREREEGSRRSLERLGLLRRELHGRLAVLRGQSGEGEEEQERLRGEAEKVRVELELLLARREEEKVRYGRLRERFEEGAERIAEEEEALKRLRLQADQARQEAGALQLQGQELALEAEHLRGTILERYRLDLAEEGSAPLSPFDPEEGERRLKELRRLIDEIGEVNLTAIEEYQELEKRYDFLTVQQEDLRQSLEGLQTAIAKINRTTRKRFRETFDLVNAKFQEIFPRLFRGGRAELTLTDEEDLLETGIEIVVQPPGKKLQSVNLLSGGEKALTAVALIFSIFLIKPSPFCMLDEVDAPLDDANIGRFNEMIREMSAVSQFIIITHSKRTMEVADTLYGVTMEEPGVSKLVSVRMHDFQV